MYLVPQYESGATYFWLVRLSEGDLALSSAFGIEGTIVRYDDDPSKP